MILPKPLYSSLDARTELEQQVAKDLKETFESRGATVIHHGTAAAHAPSVAPADITVTFKAKQKTVHLLVEVAKRKDASEYQSIQAHLDLYVSKNPSEKVFVLYSGLSTSVRMIKLIRLENERRAQKKLLGRILYLNLDSLQEFLVKFSAQNSQSHPISNLEKLFELEIQENDLTTKRSWWKTAFPAEIKVLEELNQEILILNRKKLENLRKKIIVIENLLRQRGITGQLAHKYIIFLFFIALLEEKLNPLKNRFSVDGFNSYRESIPLLDKEDKNFKDRSIHHLIIKEIAPLPEVKNSGLMQSYVAIELPDSFIVEKIIPVFSDQILISAELDVIGIVFEALARRGEKDTRIGQFFTPEPVVKVMVQLADISVDDRILDPACGTGRFLIHALNTQTLLATESKKLKSEDKLNEIREKQLFGTDIDPWITAIAKMNMFVHGDGKSNVIRSDGLGVSVHWPFSYKPPESNFDVILTNPPLGDLNHTATAENLDRKGELGVYSSNPEAWLKDRLAIEAIDINERQLSQSIEGIKKWEENLRVAKNASDSKKQKDAERRILEWQGKRDEANKKIGSGVRNYEITRHTSKGGALFLSSAVDLLKRRRLAGLPFEWQGGVLCIVVDDAVLNTPRYDQTRKHLKNNFFIKAIISLSRETFQYLGKTNAKTSIILLIRKPEDHTVQQEPIFYAKIEKTGIDKRGKPTKNELDEILVDFRKFRNEIYNSYQNDSFHNTKFAYLNTNSVVQIIPFDPNPTAYLHAENNWRNSNVELPKFSNLKLVDILDSVIETPDQVTDVIWASVSSETGVLYSNQDKETTYQTKDLRVIRKGNILLSSIDFVKGAIGVVTEEMNGKIVSKEYYSYCINEKYLSQIDPYWLSYTLRSSKMKSVILSLVSGTSGRTRISRPEKILELPLPDFPPYEEQLELRHKIESAIKSLQDSKEFLENTNY